MKEERTQGKQRERTEKDRANPKMEWTANHMIAKRAEKDTTKDKQAHNKGK